MMLPIGKCSSHLPVPRNERLYTIVVIITELSLLDQLDDDRVFKVDYRTTIIEVIASSSFLIPC